jgi:outer membrane protein TolC
MLEQQAQKEADLGKTAGSGAIFKPGSTLPGPEKIVIELPAGAALPLSLDDAISFGLARNVRILYDQANQREVAGLTKTVFSELIPNLSVSGSTSTQQINLAAMGFKPALLGSLGKTFGIDLSHFSTIIKVDVTQAQINASQQLFNLPDFELYKAAKAEKAVIDLNSLNSRGELVQAVGTAYLQVIADGANYTNAQAEEAAAKKTFDDATAKHDAGVGTNLDALRAQVDYQQRQQATLAAQTTLQKDTMQLNRIMGLPAEQPLELTDVAPFAAFDDMDLEAAKRTAYVHRKDLLSLQAQIDVETRELHAVRYQRLPTLAFSGFYGVIGETEGLYHGDFRAEASLRFPIFREAAQRGEQDSLSAQLMALRQRQASLMNDIESQIRSAMLDVQSSHELVKVAQSNVDLAQQELSDERARFKAGIDDNLPVIDAQAAVTGSQAQLVRALYQYNVAKLNLARYTGVVESRYRTYLGMNLNTQPAAAALPPSATPQP